MTTGYKTLVVGISGPSSCGKTTLARLLRDIWPRSFILHEDDFYWPDSQIPVKNDVQDWDCLEAVDLQKLHSALEYIKQNGSLPPGLHSKEDQNSVGDCKMDNAIINRLQDVAVDTLGKKPVNIALIDGFLLYAQSMHKIRDQMDLKLFLRIDYETAKSRRNARSGYVTIEGFWQDPPGYFDNVVWRNYVSDHAYLFKDHDVEGPFDHTICEETAIYPVSSPAENDMTACLEWANGAIQRSVLELHQA